MFKRTRSFPVTSVSVSAPSHSSTCRFNFFASGYRLKTVLVNLFFFFGGVHLAGFFVYTIFPPLDLSLLDRRSLCLSSLLPLYLSRDFPLGTCIASALLILFCKLRQVYNNWFFFRLLPALSFSRSWFVTFFSFFTGCFFFGILDQIPQLLALLSRRSLYLLEW